MEQQQDATPQGWGDTYTLPYAPLGSELDDAFMHSLMAKIATVDPEGTIKPYAVMQQGDLRREGVTSENIEGFINTFDNHLCLVFSDADEERVTFDTGTVWEAAVMIILAESERYFDDVLIPRWGMALGEAMAGIFYEATDEEEKSAQEYIKAYWKKHGLRPNS